MILQGKNLIVKANGEVIAAAKSCTLNIDCEIIKVSSSIYGQWEHIIAGQKSWSVSTTHLLKMERAIDLPLHGYLFRVGAEYTLRIELSGVVFGQIIASDYLTGTAICRSSQITATEGNLAQGSFKFQGNGPLT